MLRVVKSVLESYDKNVMYSIKITKRLDILYAHLECFKNCSQYDITKKEIEELEKIQTNIANNIEIIIDCLQGMNEKDRALITDRFFKKKSYTILALEYHYSERTLQRKINKILINHFNGKKITYIFNKNF